MPESVIKIPVLSGGVSKQPPNMRLPSQTATADNVVFSVVDGMSKRPGSRYVANTSLTAGTSARVHHIHRDDSEKYLLLAQYSSGMNVSVYTTSGTACSVYTSGDSQTYMNASTSAASDLRFVTIADYTLIGNTKTAMGYSTSSSFTVTGSVYDYDKLLCTTPAIGSYWRTRNDSIAYPAGYFQYLPGGNGYATCRFNSVGAAWDVTTDYQSASENPAGFSMFFAVGGSAVTGATYTTATRTLTKTGAFANVSAGDWVNLTGGTGITAGYYQIESKTNNNTVILAASAGGSNNTDTTFDGVGKVANVCVDFTTHSLTDMDDVALVYQRGIRDALGGLEACVEWVRDKTTGYFVVTSPYAGTASFFPATNPTRTLPSAYYPPHVTVVSDITNGAGDPFYSSSFTATAGTGDAGPTTGPVVDRWVRKAAPNQSEAVLNPAKMPHQMIRLNPSGTYTGGYLQFSTDLKPYAYWRLGESSGTVAADVMEANNGTYSGGPTLAATGALNGDTNTAVTFDGINDYMDAGKLTGVVSNLYYGVTVEFWIKTSATTRKTIFTIGDSTSGYMQLEANYTGSGTNSGSFYLRIQDSAGNVRSNTRDSTGASNGAFNNGSYHHVAVTSSGSIYLDGALLGAYQVDALTNSFSTPTYNTIFGAGGGGATASNFIAATIDEIAVYRGLFNTAFAAARYNQGTNSSYSHNPIFAIFPIDWKPRYSGDAASNPLPNPIKNGKKLSDMAFFRNRLVMGAGETIMTSQDGDFFNFFLDNADNIIDSDPVEKSLSTRQVTIIDHLTEVRKNLLITTRAGRQFELGTGSNETFTPTNASLAQSTTKFTIQGVRPETLDTLVYLPSTKGGYSALHEYRSQDAVLASNADEVSAHVEGYLPTLTRVVTCGNENYVLCLGSDSAIYVYRYFYKNDSKEMSSWCRWTFDSSYTIRDMAVIGTDLFLLVDSTTAYTIERIALSKVAAESTFPYVVNVDRMFSGISGTYGGANTTWTLPFTDNTINLVVKNDGTVYSATSSGGTVTVTGQNLAASTVLIGRSYNMSVELSRAFLRDANGFADLSTQVDHRETTIRHSASGDFVMQQAKTGSATRSDSLSVTAGTTSSGEKRINHVGNSKDVTLTLSTSSTEVRPVTISSIDYCVDYVRRHNP